MPDLRIPNLNTIFIAGRLTRDPESKQAAGYTIATFGLAVSRKYRTKAGEDKEERLFIDVQAWGKTAEYLLDKVSKGRPVLVEGGLRMDEWEDKNTGQKRNKIYLVADNVQLLDWPADGQQRATPTQAPAPPRDAHDLPPDYSSGQDDIPF